MSTKYSIKVYKQYFNFACSHFLVFKDGTREPMHGHNYRVQVKGDALELQDDLVFDFLDIKPIVRVICDELDHKILLPKDNPFLKIYREQNNYHLHTLDGSFFSFPASDVLLLPLSNTSAERLAIYICSEIKQRVLQQFNFTFSKLEIEVEETPGQSAIYQSLQE